MQVSFVCSEHSIKSRSAEDRLNRQNAGSPSLGTRGKFRAVAMVARSLGQLSVQNAPSSSESSVKQPGMKYRNLGKSGLRVSCLGLGTWVTFGGQITDEMAEQLMTLAYDNGINLFDTAEVYAAGKAEVVLGNIIKKKGWRRSSLVITTKIFWGGKAETERGLSRKHIIEGLKASLERLQLEYVDVVFANRPDPNTPMEGSPFSSSKSRTFIIEGTPCPHSARGRCPHPSGVSWAEPPPLICIPVPRRGQTLPRSARAAAAQQNHPAPSGHRAVEGEKAKRLRGVLDTGTCAAVPGPRQGPSRRAAGSMPGRSGAAGQPRAHRSPRCLPLAAATRLGLAPARMARSRLPPRPPRPSHGSRVPSLSRVSVRGRCFRSPHRGGAKCSAGTHGAWGCSPCQGSPGIASSMSGSTAVPSTSQAAAPSVPVLLLLQKHPDTARPPPAVSTARAPHTRAAPANPTALPSLRQRRCEP
ncbi:uncharacterized protein [Patagioenas fasciata]